MVAATPITITLFWQMQWHWYIVIMITTTITTKITWMWVYWLLQFPLYQDDSAQKDVIVSPELHAVVQEASFVALEQLYHHQAANK